MGYDAGKAESSAGSTQDREPNRFSKMKWGLSWEGRAAPKGSAPVKKRDHSEVAPVQARDVGASLVHLSHQYVQFGSGDSYRIAQRSRTCWIRTGKTVVLRGGGCRSTPKPPRRVYRFRYALPSRFAADGGGGSRTVARRGGTAGSGKMRRYCAGNRLNRWGTLMYAGVGCHDPAALRVHVGEFFRELRRELGGQPLPYAWTADRHKTGHGLHVHFAVGQFVPRSKIERA